MMNPSHINIVATGPSGFPGASQIMSQTLREMAKLGCCTNYVGTRQPFIFDFIDSQGMIFHVSNPISSNAISADGAVASQDVLLCHRLAQRMIEVALSTPKQNQLILWGTYLFPYGYAAFLAKQSLMSYGVPASLWLTPTGSDIWEIGPHLNHVVRQLLTDKIVSRVITYTRTFAQEIRERYEIEKEIVCIYPMLDWSRFHPAVSKEKQTIRKQLDISDGSFVISCHSNMRPVKCPSDVIDIAAAVAKKINRELVLLMVGPIIDDTNLQPEVFNDLRIISTGVVGRVEQFLWASDVELNCSRHDSFNLSLAEAMACGLPCVSTDVVGIGNEILKSGGGMLFKYEERNEFSEGACTSRYASAVNYITLLAQQESLRRDIGDRARFHALTTFCPSLILPKYLELIH